MFEVWILLMGIITTSDTFFLTGMTATLKTYSDHFPWFIPDGNSSFVDMTESSSSRFDTNTENPTTLKEYVQELPTDYNNTHKTHSSETSGDSKVVVVARIGDYDETGGEWTIIAEPKERNKTFDNNGKNGSEQITESIDYFLGNDDVQKYLNDYQDLLYTFKDFVKIGANPNIRKNISQYNVTNEKNEKIFNVTYVMPIPKTKKYFEIKLSNLTKTQYNEINTLLQNHILRKSNSTEITKNKEQEVVHVDENTMADKLTSHALLDRLSSNNQTSTSILQSSRFYKDLTSEDDPKPDYFGPLLTPEGFNYFLKNFDSIHINLNNKSVDKTIFQPGTPPPTLLLNNGFHAEIATDYVKRHDGNGEGHEQENSFSKTKQNAQDLSSSNYEQVEPGNSVLSPHTRRNKTKLFSQNRSKRPIMNAPNVLYTRKRKILPAIVTTSEQPITSVSFTLPPSPNYNASISNSDHVSTSPKHIVDEPLDITTMKPSQNITTNNNSEIMGNNNANFDAQDRLEIYKLNNSSLKNPTIPSIFSDPKLDFSNELFGQIADKVLTPLDVMEAAKWLIDVKRKMDEDERVKTERYKSYIKQYLRGDKDSTLSARGSNGNIMKINKQENILEELKFLMLEYFDLLNFKTQEVISNNTSSAAQLILNATNIFELVEQSSQLIKLNLRMKLQSETQDPTKFAKRIFEKQTEKCKKMFDKSLVVKAKQKSTNSTQRSGHRRFMAFTKCMNIQLNKCIKGFTLWIAKGKYFLRPQFRLDRAYENYEIERNLHCLRNNNPTSLGSNLHGIRVKPEPKVNRKSGSLKIKARKNKQRNGMRANIGNKNRQHYKKSGRTKIERMRRYKQRKLSNQQPKVQRYSDQ